jgi:CTP:molybdopterin cytidylyltransferase MocA
MDAVVAAGGTPLPGDPLYPFTQGQPKALLDLCGKPMIQWVLDALCAAPTVDHVVIVGLDPATQLTCSKAIAYLPDAHGLLENVRAGARRIQELDPQAEHFLFVSSDIPGITAEMVTWVAEAGAKPGLDGSYNVITRATMERRYPNSRRSYVRFRDVEVCGGDMNVLRVASVLGHEQDELWQAIINSRKNALKQAMLIGLDTLFLILFRLATLDQALAQVTQRLHLNAQAVICPYAEVGMDVDKPAQLELVRADMASRPV